MAGPFRHSVKCKFDPGRKRPNVALLSELTRSAPSGLRPKFLPKDWRNAVGEEDQGSHGSPFSVRTLILQAEENKVERLPFLVHRGDGSPLAFPLEYLLTRRRKEIASSGLASEAGLGSGLLGGPTYSRVDWTSSSAAFYAWLPAWTPERGGIPCQ